MKYSIDANTLSARIVLTILVLVSLTALKNLAATRSSTQFDYRTRIGVAESNSKNNFCINIDTVLKPGSKVAIVWGGRRQSITSAVVGASLPGGCAMHADSAANSYALTRTAGAKPDTAIGIAIVDPPGQMRVRRGQAEIDLDKDGRQERFRICTSNEGLHLTIWSGVPLQGVRRWHQYYALGYDVVPNCSGKDYNGT